jgi:hypothetical protein
LTPADVGEVFQVIAEVRTAVVERVLVVLDAHLPVPPDVVQVEARQRGVDGVQRAHQALAHDVRVLQLAAVLVHHVEHVAPARALLELRQLDVQPQLRARQVVQQHAGEAVGDALHVELQARVVPGDFVVEGRNVVQQGNQRAVGEILDRLQHAALAGTDLAQARQHGLAAVVGERTPLAVAQLQQVHHLALAAREDARALDGHAVLQPVAAQDRLENLVQQARLVPVRRDDLEQPVAPFRAQRLDQQAALARQALQLGAMAAALLGRRALVVERRHLVRVQGIELGLEHDESWLAAGAAAPPIGVRRSVCGSYRSA